MISASSPGAGPSGSGSGEPAASRSASDRCRASGSEARSPPTTQTAPDAAHTARTASRPADRDTGTATAPALSTPAHATAYLVQSDVEQGSRTRSPGRTPRARRPRAAAFDSRSHRPKLRSSTSTRRWAMSSGRSSARRRSCAGTVHSVRLPSIGDVRPSGRLDGSTNESLDGEIEDGDLAEDARARPSEFERNAALYPPPSASSAVAGCFPGDRDRDDFRRTPGPSQSTSRGPSIHSGKALSTPVTRVAVPLPSVPTYVDVQVRAPSSAVRRTVPGRLPVNGRIPATRS